MIRRFAFSLLLPIIFAAGIAKGATLVPQATPDAVAAAVARIHELGRDQLDIGGVAAVRVFSVDGTATLADVAGLILEAVKNDQESALLAHCEEELGVDCAVALAAQAGAPRTLAFLAELGNRMVLTTGLVGIEADFRVLERFVLDKVGADYVELGARANVFGVDVGSAILVDPTLRRVVVVHYDAGA